MLFSRAEGIIPGSRELPCHRSHHPRGKEGDGGGAAPVLLFCLSGHGLIDMPSYESYLNGDLQNYKVSDEEIEKYLKNVPQVD